MERAYASGRDRDGLQITVIDLAGGDRGTDSSATKGSGGLRPAGGSDIEDHVTPLDPTIREELYVADWNGGCIHRGSVG